MSIKDWPQDERPREKLLARGAAALSDAELLAIFLRTGVQGKSALDVARDLITHFNGLSGLLDAQLAEFCQVKGLGSAKFAQLHAVLELSRRYLHSRLQRGNALTDPDMTAAYLSTHLRGHRQEVFACLFLDNRHRVISFEKMFHGTIDGASVHPREVVRQALFHNAAALIFAHNHPSGVAEPSPADISITQRLKDALALIDVRVLDHFVIGDGAPVSFAQRGLL
jgi:DNA repair protein RadC